MRKEIFKQLLDEEFELIRQIWATKGEEYTRSDDDQLINFKRRGEEAGIRPEQAWLVLAGKHWDSIVSWIHDGEVKSEESIEGRIRDEILYLYLLLGLARERAVPAYDLTAVATEEITGSSRNQGSVSP